MIYTLTDQETRKKYLLPTYHAIAPDGGPPADGVHHLRWDCRNLTRITRRQPERLRRGRRGQWLGQLRRRCRRLPTIGKEDVMQRPQETGKQLKRLAGEVLAAVIDNSAGEMSRRQNWGFFVKNIYHDHTLLELADECFDAMDEDQKRRFIARIRQNQETLGPQYRACDGRRGLGSKRREN